MNVHRSRRRLGEKHICEVWNGTEAPAMGILLTSHSSSVKRLEGKEPKLQDRLLHCTKALFADSGRK